MIRSPSGSHLLASWDAPCSVGLVLDISGSLRNTLSAAKGVTQAFFRTANPEDEFLLLTVSTQPAATSVERAVTRMAESPEVMNIRQASQYLGISPDTLYKYVYEEKIPAFKLGNRWKFKKTILDSWMEQKSSMGEGKAKKRPRAARAAAAR